MTITIGLRASLAVIVAAALTSPGTGVRAAADVARTVYLSAVDANGEFVTDLTAADLAVKEDNKVRQVTRLVPATEPCHIAVLVDDGGEGTLQAPVVDLLNAASGRDQFAISLLNPQSIQLNDYTSDHQTLQASIQRLVQRGRVPWDPQVLTDAVGWTARDVRKREMSRPVIITLTNRGESTEPTIAREVLQDLKDSGAQLHAVYVVGAELNGVLVDGPPQSGGSSTVASSTRGFSDALTGIARTLAHQYALTYVLPDGVKPDDRVQVATTRPNVKIVAPTRIRAK
jgi:hypothetical protein